MELYQIRSTTVRETLTACVRDLLPHVFVILCELVLPRTWRSKDGLTSPMSRIPAPVPPDGRMTRVRQSRLELGDV